MSDQARTVSIAHIKQVVAAAFGVTAADLDSPCRRSAYVKPRQLAIALALELTGHSTTVVGKMFGRRDHTTVMHASRKARHSYGPEMTDLREAVLAPPSEAGEILPEVIEVVAQPPAPLIATTAPAPEPRAVTFTPRKVMPTRVIARPRRPRDMTAYLMGDPGAKSARVERGEMSKGVDR